MQKLSFQKQNKTVLICFDKRRIRSLCRMNYFALFLFVLSTLSASATPTAVRHYKSSGEAFNGPDRTITWRPWQQNAKDEFRFRTGDRYLGRAVWEHYLGFEQLRTSSKAIKLSMIRLGNKDVPEEVVIRPGSRYAILKVTNGTTTAHTGVWSWTAQEVDWTKGPPDLPNALGASRPPSPGE
jgi:hypothetical protein